MAISQHRLCNVRLRTVSRISSGVQLGESNTFFTTLSSLIKASRISYPPTEQTVRTVTRIVTSKGEKKKSFNDMKTYEISLIGNARQYSYEDQVQIVAPSVAVSR
jgi:hypothetical protein